jgi:hypothetical protein
MNTTIKGAAKAGVAGVGRGLSGRRRDTGFANHGIGEHPVHQFRPVQRDRANEFPWKRARQRLQLPEALLDDRVLTTDAKAEASR